MVDLVIGAYQMNDVHDTDQAITQLADALEQAAAEEVDVVCFPECFLQGYTGDEYVARERALSIDSPAFQKILDRLVIYRTTLVLGLIELYEGALYNTAVVIRAGRFVGKYWKHHPNEGIYEPGTSFPVFDANGVTFGVAICNDANFDAVSQRLATNGAQVIFYPLNNRLRRDVAERWRSKHIQNLIDRAVASQCWVVSSDVIANEGNEVGYGHTAIVSPDGVVVNQVKELSTGLIRHTIHLD